MGVALLQDGESYVAAMLADTLSASLESVEATFERVSLGIDASLTGVQEGDFRHVGSLYSGGTHPAGMETPEFSGSTMQFGYVIGRGSKVAYQSTIRADDWRVTLHTQPVPEPGTFALVALAGGSLLWRKRRRRLAA